MKRDSRASSWLTKSSGCWASTAKTSVRNPNFGIHGEVLTTEESSAGVQSQESTARNPQPPTHSEKPSARNPCMGNNQESIESMPQLSLAMILKPSFQSDDVTAMILRQ